MQDSFANTTTAPFVSCSHISTQISLRIVHDHQQQQPSLPRRHKSRRLSGSKICYFIIQRRFLLVIMQ
jgi:hypothetical protein